MTAYTFRISLDCPHCRSGVPVNAFTNELLCSNCLRTIELDQAWWEGNLDNETLEEALTFEPGHGNSSQRLGGMNEKIESGNRPPRCQHCKAEFSVDLLQKAEPDGGFGCPGCKKRIRVRKATPLALSLIPEADLLVHEDETGDGLGNDGKAAMEPVLFACLACSAGLKVDGTTRTPACTHCGSSNYLPDPLWLRLHPAAVSHAFFVTRKAEVPPTKIEAGKIPDTLSSEKALRLLKDQQLDPQTVQRIFEVTEEEDEVYEALAKHPNTPREVLLKLCDTDRYYKVRVAVAKRPYLPVGVLPILAADNDSDVKKAVFQRPDLWELPEHELEVALSGMDEDDLGPALQNSKFPEWKLYDISDNCTPEAARKILRSPAVSLRVMRRLGSNPDSRPLIKEHPMYKELSWWQKLFFFG